MRLLYLLNLSISFLLLNDIYSQATDKSNNFIIIGEIFGKDTGKLILWYIGYEHKVHRDTANLEKGKYTFSGNSNIACEAILWTDINDKVYDDNNMLRFILEPGNIDIFCNAGDAIHASVTGIKSQTEKQEWDKKKAYLTDDKTTSYEILKSNKYQIRMMDLGYIIKHKNSYLSGFLLSYHKRRISIDSLQFLYDALTQKVKRSDFGHDVLSYLYPLTNDTKFRDANPIFGSGYNSRLKKIKSIYDISIPDTSGNSIGLSRFRGQYLIIDFWASWCSPCIQNIPYLEKLKEHYKNAPLQLISYSVDTDSAKWKTAIKKYNFSGFQVSDLDGFYGMLPVYCKEVVGVPRYMLFDKTGKLINDDLPQPGDKQLNEILNNLFMKN